MEKGISIGAAGMIFFPYLLYSADENRSIKSALLFDRLYKPST